MILQRRSHSRFLWKCLSRDEFDQASGEPQPEADWAETSAAAAARRSRTRAASFIARPPLRERSTRRRCLFWANDSSGDRRGRLLTGVHVLILQLTKGTSHTPLTPVRAFSLLNFAIARRSVMPSWYWSFSAFSFARSSAIRCSSSCSFAFSSACRSVS